MTVDVGVFSATGGGGSEWASTTITSVNGAQQSFTLTGMLPATQSSFIVRWNRPSGALQYDGAGSGKISIGTSAEHVFIKSDLFSGNLTSSDDNVQKLAEKFDDLSVGRDLSWTPTLATGSTTGITMTVDSSSAYQVGNSITYRFSLRVNRGTAPNLDVVNVYLSPPHAGPFNASQHGYMTLLHVVTESVAPNLQTLGSNRLRIFFNLASATTASIFVSGFGVYTIN